MRIYQIALRSAKILLLTMFAASCDVAISATNQNKTEFDDWITSGTCSKDQNILCQGYYKQPTYSDIDTATEAKQPVTVKSDEANFVSKGTPVFEGRVIANQGNKFIHSDQAKAEHNSQTGGLETITAIGNVKLTQPGLRIDGAKAELEISKDRKVIDDAVYRIYDRHARGTANTIIVDGKSKMTMSEASYTSCAPNSNAWHIKANKAEFDRDTGRGQAWDAKLYLKDTPVFYWPYVNFPIDKRRQTGFLQPSLENSTRSGKTIILPFYWNIAPNYDSTITSNYMTKRGMKFDTVWRYLTRSSYGYIDFDFLPEDREYRALRNQQRSNAAFMNSTDTATILRRNDLKNRDFRYRFQINNSTKFTKNLLLMIDYTNASDGNYLYDFYDTQSESVDDQFFTIYALQRASLQYNNYFGSLKYQLEEYKTFHVINGPNGVQQLSKLPEVSFNSATFNLPYNFNFSTNVNYVKFKPRTVLDDTNLLSYGQRLQARPAIGYDIVAPGWFIKPRVQLNHVQYSALHISPKDLSNGVKDKSSHLSIPMYDVKGGLIFERDMKFNNIDFVQTLEPQLYYLYVPNKNQDYLPNFDSSGMNFDYNQVFRDNRYSGLDRVAEANQLGIGLASKFINTKTGEEQGMLGIGRIRYFRKPVLRLKEVSNIDKDWSAIAMIARLRLSAEYSLEANLVRYKQQTDTASLQLQYRPNPKQVINFGYEYLRNPAPDLLTGNLSSDIKQIKVSTAWQTTPSLRLLGLISYDLRFSRELDSLAGVEYHTCCTALRVLWGRTWDASTLNTRAHDNKFRIQFIFKGFAGVGNAEDGYISRKISGYVG